ncbi:hypothetical protein B0H66DRAFT_274846 [Apodospora peruviana]|uniref:Complex 1 LYR protein domain-containing protein n=1 Tax=Apodospora peruviana TaxID=516989 RepID=A0AAE0I0G5_9PEZI|nr:hypothetical protein B0H66DRAFT_274846 [Apodospora peruviana]
MTPLYRQGRDSRHRRACCALYRALLRQGKRVPVPDDIATGPWSASAEIGNLVRRGFRRNRKDISHRLIVAALKDGYKFLGMFGRVAQDTEGEEHASVITFLRENKKRVEAIHAKQAAERAAKPVSPHPDRVPILTLLPPTKKKPGPVYVATNRPRPLSELSGGVRKLPTLDDCMGYPFLRLGKPQSPELAGVIRRIVYTRQRNIRELLSMKKYEMSDAKIEDEWDGMMDLLAEGRKRKMGTTPSYGEIYEQWWQAGQEIAEKIKKGRRTKWYEEPERLWDRDWPEMKEISFADSWRIFGYELAIKLAAQQQDMVARGKALWKIALAERELAEKEAKERGERLVRPMGDQEMEMRENWKRAWSRRQVKERLAKMYEAEEKGDHETAKKLANRKFKVQVPLRVWDWKSKAKKASPKVVS